MHNRGLKSRIKRTIFHNKKQRNYTVEKQTKDINTQVIEE